MPSDGSCPAAVSDHVSGSRAFRPRLALGLVLAASVAIRIPLVLAGGRFFIADEGRYLRGHFAYFHLRHGDFAAVKAVLRHSDNIGFDAISLLTTATQHALSGFVSPHGWAVTLDRLNESFVLGALLLAMAPVVSIWLVYGVARRIGADEGEALGGALLLSLSNTAFYFSRHLVPYDCALAVALAAVFSALGSAGIRRSLVAGILAGASFHIYNGYWFLVPLVVAVRGRHGGSSARAGLTRAAITATGAATVIALPYAIGCWVYGRAFLESTVSYGHSIVQGLYREGWSLPWEYFWHTEGAFGVLAVGLPLGMAVWRRAAPIPGRVRGLIGCAAGIYATWVLVSSVGHLFVINARTVKPLVPIVCLIGGWGLAASWRRNLRFGWLAAATFVACGLINLLPNYGLVFPREFEAAVRAKVGAPKLALSVSGSHLDRTNPKVTAPDYLMLNGQYLYPIRSAVPVPTGQTVLAAAHALAHLPYQYDGFTPRQRSILRSTDIRMRLIHLDHPAATPDVPAAALQVTDADWPDGFDSEASLALPPAVPPPGR